MTLAVPREELRYWALWENSEVPDRLPASSSSLPSPAPPPPVFSTDLHTLKGNAFVAVVSPDEVLITHMVTGYNTQLRYTHVRLVAEESLGINAAAPRRTGLPELGRHSNGNPVGLHYLQMAGRDGSLLTGVSIAAV